MNNQANTKITSILELAKYKIGDKPYWVALRHIGSKDIVINQADTWMCGDNMHPKIFYERGYAHGSWQFREKLPKLCSSDFSSVIDILSSDLFVERFEIAGVSRSKDTGEFLYTNTSKEWIPESQLFPTITLARKEKMRIKLLFRKWSNRVFDDRV